MAVLAPMPERERQDRDRGIARALGEGPEGVDKVLRQRLHKGEIPLNSFETQPLDVDEPSNGC